MPQYCVHPGPLRRCRRAAVSVLVLGAVLAAGTPGVGAQTTGSLDPGALVPVVDSVQTASAQKGWTERCTPVDAGLAEASGLAVLGSRVFAVADGDGSSTTKIAELGTDCVVTRWIDTGVVGLDTEDLAAVDGRLVVADIGDNAASRDRVSLIIMDPDDPSSVRVQSFRYTDGPRDAEALLVAPDGRFVLVSKEVFGTGRISRPVGDPTIAQLDGGVTDLEPAGTVRLDGDGTGSLGLGAVGSGTAGSSTPLGAVTGGAVAPDGSVAVLRTYWQVFLYPLDGTDLASALTVRPTVLAAPAEPQGEAVAVDGTGDLLLLSEWAGGAGQPLWSTPIGS